MKLNKAWITHCKYFSTVYSNECSFDYNYIVPIWNKVTVGKLMTPSVYTKYWLTRSPTTVYQMEVRYTQAP